jgi:hypothetical protein
MQIQNLLIDVVKKQIVMVHHRHRQNQSILKLHKELMKNQEHDRHQYDY